VGVPPPALRALHGARVQLPVHRRLDGSDGFQLLRSPAGIAFQLLTLAFALYHSVTWFNLTPKALPVPFIAAAHYALWAALSAGLAYLAS